MIRIRESVESPLLLYKKSSRIEHDCIEKVVHNYKEFKFFVAWLCNERMGIK